MWIFIAIVVGTIIGFINYISLNKFHRTDEQKFLISIGIGILAGAVVALLM